MMSLSEAIKHAEEVASRKFDDRVHCIKCAEEHRQLAEWLEELKRYRHALDMVNREANALYGDITSDGWMLVRKSDVIAIINKAIEEVNGNDG